MAAPDVEAVDFEPEEDDLMEDDAGAAEADGSPRAAHPRIRSAITGAGSSSAGGRRTKGRGFHRDAETERHSRLSARDYETLDSDGGLGPAQSIEGWIVLVTGVHEEAQDDDIHNAFGEYGPLKSVHLNLDRRTGFVKGYALIEYERFEEAQDAITLMNGTTMLEQTINVDWAFWNGPCRRMGNVRRSRSPARRRY